MTPIPKAISSLFYLFQKEGKNFAIRSSANAREITLVSRQAVAPHRGRRLYGKGSKGSDRVAYIYRRSERRDPCPSNGLSTTVHARARLRIGARCIPNDTRSRKKAGHRRRFHCDRVTRMYVLRVCMYYAYRPIVSRTYERNDRSSYILRKKKDSPLPGTHLPNSSPPNRNHKNPFLAKRG